MTRKRTIGILTVLTAAAASVFALTQGKLSAEQPAPPTVTPTETVTASQPCAYTWAYKDLPEISAEFEASVKAALPEANAHALNERGGTDLGPVPVARLVAVLGVLVDDEVKADGSHDVLLN